MSRTRITIKTKKLTRRAAMTEMIKVTRKMTGETTGENRRDRTGDKGGLPKTQTIKLEKTDGLSWPVRLSF
jgi:hypothetical protein